jgi:hypothetical protein
MDNRSAMRCKQDNRSKIIACGASKIIAVQCGISKELTDDERKTIGWTEELAQITTPKQLFLTKTVY